MKDDYIDDALKERIKDERIQVSDLVNNRIDDTLSSLAPNKKRLFYRTKIAASIAVGILALSSFIPIHANGIPIVGSAFQFFIDSKDSNDKVVNQYVKFSEAVNQSVKNKGIKVTINEVSCDKNKLIIGFTIDSKKKIKAGEIFDADFSANKKRINGSYDVNEKNENDNRVKGILTKDVSNEILPEKFNLDFNLIYVGEVKGTWNFKFNVSKQETDKNTKVYSPGITAQLPYYNISINRITTSPFANTIAMTQTSNNISIPTNNYHFLVVDENENILTTKFVSGNGSGNGYNETTSFFVKNQQLKSITLIPYRNKFNEFLKVEFTNAEDISKLPITFDIGYRGSVTIDKIEFNDKNTVVNYETKGYSCTGIYLVDEAGNEISYDDSPYPNPKLIDGEKGEYTANLKKADKNKTYKIKVAKNPPVEFFDDYKIKIPLK